MHRSHTHLSDLHAHLYFCDKFWAHQLARRFCKRVVKHRLFDRFILSIIIINCFFLAADNPLNSDEDLATTIKTADDFFLAIFTAELVIKMYALGLVRNKDSYFQVLTIKRRAFADDTEKTFISLVRFVILLVYEHHIKTSIRILFSLSLVSH